MPTPESWYGEAERLRRVGQPCTHEITEQVYCEEDCCGASLIWEECRCGQWIYLPMVGRVPAEEAWT